MNHVIEQTLTKCSQCRAVFVSPTTICERCEPQAWHEERRRWQESAKVARAISLDRYAMSIIGVLADGSYVLVRDAYSVMRDGDWKHHDTLIRDLTQVKEENTQLLAENARLRRRLESGK